MTTSGSETKLLGFRAPRTCSSESQESHTAQNLPNHDLDPHAPPLTTTPTLPSSTLPSSSGSGSNRSLYSLSSDPCPLQSLWSTVPGARSLYLVLSPDTASLPRCWRPATAWDAPWSLPDFYYKRCKPFAPQEPSSRAAGSKGERKEERRATEKPNQNRKCADALGDPPCTHVLHN